MAGMDETDDVPPESYPQPAHVDGALMISFGAVIPGREGAAVDSFTRLSRYLGRLLSDEAISRFQPFFFADGLEGDVRGFFLLEGRRERLDQLRRESEFVHELMVTGGGVANLRCHTLIAGSEAGRLVNLYRAVRAEMGFL
jgi:hypothetical protein